MVEKIKVYLSSNATYCKLNDVSDGICSNNSKQYIDFDKFVSWLHSNKIIQGDTLSSCDTLILNKDQNHLVLVEFKDMNSLDSEENISSWWRGKNRSVYLKITDTILLLSHYMNKQFGETHDDFMNLSKSFIYVYSSQNYKKTIHTHLKYKFSRYNFLFENIKTVEAKQFEKFLDYNNL